MSMSGRFLSYVIIRLLITFFTVFLLVTVIFFAMRFLPGDPAVVILGEKARPDQVAALREKLGLNRPIHIQYFEYIQNLVTGNLGESFGYESINMRIAQSIGPTVELALSGVFIGVVIGILSGLGSVIKQGRLPDIVMRLFVLFGYSIPVFALGLIVQLIFVFVLPGFLPTTGSMGIAIRPPRVTGFLTVDSVLALDFSAFLSALTHLILPATVLGITLAAPVANLTRENTIKILHEDFILMSRVMGLPKNRILIGHAFRNTLLPLITYTGLSISALLGGAVLLETVYARPGLGHLLVFAINSRDFPMVQGVIAYWAFIISIVSFITDISYAFIDPRVKLG